MDDILKSPSLKLGISIALAFVVLGLFWVSRNSITYPSAEAAHELSPQLALVLDREVDSVLAHCNIEKGWIRKSSVPLTNSGLTLFERRVAIPRDVLPVQVNVAMNVMAKRYNAKVVAYENIRENTIALHIEFHGQVIEKIVLKQNNALQRREYKNASPKT